MRQDAWRAYAEIVLGMTEASRKRASKVAKQMLGKGGATAEQVQTFADELFKAGVTNREQLTVVVRAELDKALARVGLVKAEEVATLESRVRDLEARLSTASTAPVPENPPAAAQKVADEARVEAAAAKSSAVGTSVRTAPVKTVAKKTVAKKAVVKQAPGSAEPAATVEVVAAPAAGPTTPSPSKVAPVRKTVAKKAVAKKTTAAAPAPAKKAPAAKKTTGGAV